MNAGTTNSITYSFDINSHNPSEAITINLWSMIKKSITFCDFEFYNLGFTNDSNFWGHYITKWSGHCKTWNVLCFHPNSIRSHLLSILIKIWCNSASVYDNSLSFDWILTFMILRKWMCSPFFSNSTKNYCPWVSKIWTVDFILMNVSHASCCTWEFYVNIRIFHFSV